MDHAPADPPDGSWPGGLPRHVREAKNLIEEARLVAQAQKGDEGAFGELMESCRGRGLALAASVLGPHRLADAEDATQSAVIRAYRGLGHFRGEASFAAWFFRIVRNEALAMKERARIRIPHSGQEELDRLAQPEGSPEGLALRVQLQADLHHAVERLPSAYQAVVRLYYGQDWSVDEIAEALATPPNTIKSYLFRSRKLLQTLLAQQGYGHESSSQR